MPSASRVGRLGNSYQIFSVGGSAVRSASRPGHSSSGLLGRVREQLRDVLSDPVRSPLVECDAAQPPGGELVDDLAVEEAGGRDAVQAHDGLATSRLPDEALDPSGGEVPAGFLALADDGGGVGQEHRTPLPAQLVSGWQHGGNFGRIRWRSVGSAGTGSNGALEPNLQLDGTPSRP
jgi:hypothetical protein